MRDLLKSKIAIALPTMLGIQSFGMMCGYASAVVAVQASANPTPIASLSEAHHTRLLH